MFKNIFSLLILTLTVLTLPLNAKEHIDVLTYHSEPFVMINDGKYSGFSVDLMGHVAQEIGQSIVFHPVKNVAEILSAVRTGDYEMGMSSVSITAERESYLDFSYPFFYSGLDILVKSSDKHVSRFFKSFFNLIFSKPIVDAFLIAISLLLFFAHCIWFFERYKNSDKFPRTYVLGIKEAIWWTAITVTIAGYGNKAPKTTFGRLTSVVWMFTSIFFVAFFTATITSSFTIQQLKGAINGHEDLRGKRIGVVGQSTAARFLKEIHTSPVTYSTTQDMFEGFERGAVDVLVYDSPLLQYYAKTKGAGKVETVGALFEKQDYGILFPQGSEYRESVNTALLKLKENGVYDELLSRWFLETIFD